MVRYLLLVTRRLITDDTIVRLMKTDSDLTQLVDEDSNVMPLLEAGADIELSPFQLPSGDSIGAPSRSLNIQFIHRPQTSSL
jgi:hypothetical protein